MELSHISRNKNPKKASYISGNRTFQPSFEKISYTLSGKKTGEKSLILDVSD